MSLGTQKTESVSLSELKRFRNCIVCDQDNYETLFDYTYDFLIQVRDTDPAYLDSIGWARDTTSSIVKCHRCGAIYVRDVFLQLETKKPARSEEDVLRSQNNPGSYKSLGSREQAIWILSNLLQRVGRQFKRNIKLLDYGAGSGTWCNLARVLGVREVFAYDPFSSYRPEFYRTYNFPGIVASRSWQEIREHGPFDVVVCNAVFEHLSHPESDVQRIYDHMTPTGYAYLHNPFMDVQNELPALKRADKIHKSMAISHYHPGHVNYLTPAHFKRFVEKFSFEAIPIAADPFTPPGDLKRFLRRTAKSLLLQLGLLQADKFLLQKTK